MNLEESQKKNEGIDEMKAHSLDVPQATELMHELRKCGIDVSDEVLNEEEALAEILKLGIKGKAVYTDIPDYTESDSTPNAAEIKNLTHKYSVGTPFESTAVDNVSLQIKKGSFIGVIGHTGSGKSTLIQHLNGLLKPTGGEILIEENKKLKKTNNELMEKIKNNNIGILHKLRNIFKRKKLLDNGENK